MITREQVADLQPGDVVELSDEAWHGATLRGPLRLDSEALMVGVHIVREYDGLPYRHESRTLTVVSRAPRPLYVNHPRTEPVVGDVVRLLEAIGPGPFLYTGSERYAGVQPHGRMTCWVGLRGGCPDTGPLYAAEQGRPIRLLVDGETGEVVQ